MGKGVSNYVRQARRRAAFNAGYRAKAGLAKASKVQRFVTGDSATAADIAVQRKFYNAGAAAAAKVAATGVAVSMSDEFDDANEAIEAELAEARASAVGDEAAFAGVSDGSDFAGADDVADDDGADDAAEVDAAGADDADVDDADADDADADEADSDEADVDEADFDDADEE